ncbi:hypothetical protein I6F43_16270 [Pseudoalteromonas sp. NZS71_1]|jgi:hypothetical protein|uniref:hypothetical protein n=1 Tax=Pseudoalteromonas sp. NZS71_1 TaxID=2792072 RepID=UPI0018CD5AFA|nr:hypothetical protein [Pseudoalteromonas sp. NZS71_1]MBH0036200.1 hypothetical protein [Pseudoalteromonas sp. NZS71_1]
MAKVPEEPDHTSIKKRLRFAGMSRQVIAKGLPFELILVTAKSYRRKFKTTELKIKSAIMQPFRYV